MSPRSATLLALGHLGLVLLAMLVLMLSGCTPDRGEAFAAYCGGVFLLLVGFGVFFLLLWWIVDRGSR